MKPYALIFVATLTLLLGLPAGIFAQGDSANTEKEVRDALEKYRKALIDETSRPSSRSGPMITLSSTARGKS
jgi:hypothetical protein